MVKLNVGCGKRDWSSEGWIGIDIIEAPHISSHDVTKLPFEDNSVDIIVASHLIAYFSQEEAVDVLKEWFRVLKPEGVLHISTPDMFTIAVLIIETKYINKVLGPIYGRKYCEGHKTGYILDTLTKLLESIGFTNIKLYDHRTTCHPNTGNMEDFYDDHSAAYINDTLISLNIQATKPIA